MVSCPLIESQHYIFYNPSAKLSLLMLHSFSKLPLGSPSFTFLQLSRAQEMLLTATATLSLEHSAKMPPTLGWKKVLPPRYRDICASLRHTNKFLRSIRVWFGFEQGRFQGWSTYLQNMLRKQKKGSPYFCGLCVFLCRNTYPENSSSSS